MMTDAELPTAAETLEAQCGRLTECNRCGGFLRGRIQRRIYKLAGGFALLVFCEACHRAVPEDGPENAQFRAELERVWAVIDLPAQGLA
jgi:hypothetical protein